MESFPAASGPETVSQPDLLAAYADREVNIFGITGTLQDLAGMCPIDLNDARVTLEAKNEFIIKAANEAGLEIEPQHEEIFKRVTEQYGLDRKFTVAKPDISSSTDKGNTPTQTPLERKTASVDRTEPREERKAVSPVEIGIQRELQIEELVRSQLDRGAELDKLSEPATEKVRLPAEGTKVVMEQTIKGANEQSSVVQTLSEEVEILYGDNEVFVVEHPTVVTELAGEAMTDDTASDEQFIGNLEESFRVDESIKSKWAVELSKEPVEMLEDFTEALVALSELLSLPTATNADSDSEFFSFQDDAEKSEASPPPLILVTVIERLSELETDEKQFVAPILKNIVGAIHGLELLEQGGAEIELIVEVKIQLRELCISLFEALSIEYTDRDIEQFIELMLHPNFQPAEPDEEVLDLEHMGTREAKWHFPIIGTALADMENEIQRMLGMFAVVCARAET